MELNPIFLSAQLTQHTLLIPGAGLNVSTALLLGDGQWHYTKSVMVSKFLLIRAEIDQKGLHVPTP